MVGPRGILTSWQGQVLHISFFGDGDAPNTNIIEHGAKKGCKKSRVLEALVDVSARVVEEIRQRADEDVIAIDDTLLETPQKQATQKAVEVARQKLMAANEKRQAARKIAFSTT